MSYRPDVTVDFDEEVIYEYDGSFEGLLCCVFESYDKKEIPIDILSPERMQTTLTPARMIVTDIGKSDRVLASIPAKIGPEALDLVQKAYLTCDEQKEITILRFLRKGFRQGAVIMDMLADDVVNRLNNAVRHLGREAHLLKGFVRFSVANGVLVAEIEPKNFVLPLLAPHFCERYPGERFLIYDKTHGMGLIYQPTEWAIFPIDSLEMPQPDENEENYRELWRLFYKTIEIQGRHNPRCRMSHMPKRYWKTMTEFSGASSGNAKPALSVMNEPAEENRDVDLMRVIPEQVAAGQ